MSGTTGTLYVVSTPIGNLADMTYRAVETLRAVDVIACEDTRQTRKLLDHYGIQSALVSFHEHNEAARTEELSGRLERGESVAVVSDAGTPLISDPGFRLVRAAAAAGIPVVPVPGASASLAALAASGLPTDEYRFCGFLPRKQGERRRYLEGLAGESATLIFYEAPHRILESLEDVAEVLRDPPVVVARELTKLHEEMLRGAASAVAAELRARAAVKGEITLVVGKAEAGPADDTPIGEAVQRMETLGMSRMDAIKAVARERGLPKRDVYRAVEAESRSPK